MQEEHFDVDILEIVAAVVGVDVGSVVAGEEQISMMYDRRSSKHTRRRVSRSRWGNGTVVKSQNIRNGGDNLTKAE